jgi:hypothetical protein
LYLCRRGEEDIKREIGTLLQKPIDANDDTLILRQAEIETFRKRRYDRDAWYDPHRALVSLATTSANAIDSPKRSGTASSDDDNAAYIHLYPGHPTAEMMKSSKNAYTLPAAASHQLANLIPVLTKPATPSKPATLQQTPSAGAHDHSNTQPSSHPSGARRSSLGEVAAAGTPSSRRSSLEKPAVKSAAATAGKGHAAGSHDNKKIAVKGGPGRDYDYDDDGEGSVSDDSAGDSLFGFIEEDVKPKDKSKDKKAATAHGSKASRSSKGSRSKSSKHSEVIGNTGSHNDDNIPSSRPNSANFKVFTGLTMTNLRSFVPLDPVAPVYFACLNQFEHPDVKRLSTVLIR